MFLLAAFRLVGKRQLGQMTPFDLVVLLVISNVVQNALIGNDNSLGGGLSGATAILALNAAVAWLTFRSKPVRRVVRGAINAEQALDAWRGTRFRACPPDGMFAIGQATAAPSEEGADLLAARLAARVPSFSCRLGPDAYDDGARWLWSLRQGLASRAAPASRSIRA